LTFVSNIYCKAVVKV